MNHEGLLRADWPAPPGVFAVTTLRGPLGVSGPPFDTFNLGTRCGDLPGAVARNRNLLRERLGLAAEPRWLRQVHGSAVAIEPDPDEPEADAAVSRRPGTVLAVLTADCLPVLLCAGDASAVAAVHAGWRGLSAGVLESAVAAMDLAPGRLLAWLGPAAGPRSYEVGEEVYEAFVGADPGSTACFASTRHGHWLCDLYALARRRLAAAGVDRIFGGDLCTLSDRSRFFSHRRDGSSGRMASLIGIRAPD